MVPDKFQVLKEQLSTLSSLSSYVLKMLEENNCASLLDDESNCGLPISHEKILNGIIIEDCTDFGTLMIKGLIRIQRKLKQTGLACEPSPRGDQDSSANITQRTSQRDDLLPDSEVTPTGIFDALNQVMTEELDVAESQVESVMNESDEEDRNNNTGDSGYLNGSLFTNLERYTNNCFGSQSNQCLQEKGEDAETMIVTVGNGQDVSTQVTNENETADHGQKRYKCFICDRVLASYKNYLRHRKMHRDKGRYTCRYCWKVFSVPSSLKKHACPYYPTSDTSSYSCEVCHKDFSSKSDLNGHMLIHSNKRPYDCKACQRSFVSLSEFEAHVESHQTKKDIYCESCGKVFASEKSLHRHRYLHTTQKSYPCSHCSKEFVTSFELKKHALGHQYPSDYVCDVCKKSYSNQDSLQRHKRLHKLSTKSHSCPKCSQTFPLLSNLEEHLKMIHPTEKTKHGSDETVDSHTGKRVCNLCGKRYSSSRNLIRHKLLHNRSNQNPCPFCTKKFINSLHLKQHIATHMTKSPSDVCTHATRRLSISSTILARRPSTSSAVVAGTPSDSLRIGAKQCSGSPVKTRSRTLESSTHPSRSPSESSVQTGREHSESSPCAVKQSNAVSEKVCEEVRKRTCHICHKVFKARKYLRNHLVLHREKPFCKLCCRFFLTAELLEQHMDVHGPELRDALLTTVANGERQEDAEKRRRTCWICHRIFISSKNMRKHLVLHREKPFCNICRRFFLSADLFDRHMEGHTSGDIHSCEICHKALSSKSSLRHHRRLHFRHKLHICSICDKGFATPSSFRKHARTHTVEVSSRRSLSFDPPNEQSKQESSALPRSPTTTEGIDTIACPVDSGNKVDGNRRCSQCDLVFVNQMFLDKHILSAHWSKQGSEDSSLGTKHSSDNGDNSDVSIVKANTSGSMSVTKTLGQDGSDEFDKININDSRIYARSNHRSNAREVQTVEVSDDSDHPDDDFSATAESSISDLTVDAHESGTVHKGNDDAYKEDHLCLICGRKFLTEGRLSRHLGYCREYYECKVCGERFDQSRKLTKHKYRHIDDSSKPYPCNICSKRFLSATYLKKHKLTHNESKALGCEI